MSNYCPRGHWENGMKLPCKQCTIESLRAENAALKDENARLAIDNELANSMLEKLRDTNETRGKALAAQCTETKKLKARIGELEAQLNGREGWQPMREELRYLTQCADGTNFLNVVQMPAHAVAWKIAAAPKGE